jgi:hypothetical protein
MSPKLGEFCTSGELGMAELSRKPRKIRLRQSGAIKTREVTIVGLV